MAVDLPSVGSTVMKLVASCMDWAQRRRRKAAAKLHLRPDTRSFLPACAIVDTAGEHDNKRAREVCAGLHSGEVVLFDKAYVDYNHQHDLDARGVPCPRAAAKLWDSSRLLQAGGRGPKRVDPRLSTLPDMILWDSTPTSPQAQSPESKLGPLRIHPFPTGGSPAITLPEGCLCDLFNARPRSEYFNSPSNVLTFPEIPFKNNPELDGSSGFFVLRI